MSTPRLNVILFCCVSALALVFATLSALQGVNLIKCFSLSRGPETSRGQTLYRSFNLPHGPLGIFFFAPFLWIAPSGGAAILIASAVLNLLATWVIWVIIRRRENSPQVPGFWSGFDGGLVSSGFWNGLQ